MKKIVFIMPHVNGKGGTETVLKTVMKLLQQNNNYQAQLYVLGGSEDKKWLSDIDYKETVFSKNRLVRNIQNMFSIIFYLYKYLKKEKPDIVVTTHSILSFLVYCIKKITNAKYPNVSWIHFSLDAKNVKKSLLLKSDYHFAISNGIKEQFLQLGVSASNIYTIFNPIERKEKIIKRPENECVFLYVGRIIFEGQKYFKELLDGLSKVSGNWRLDVFGDGEDLETCKQYAAKLNIDHKINWKGFIPEPWNYIDEATALLLTSKYEGLPMVLAEAISNGVYCVSSDCKTGPSDIIVNNINGELYKPGNIEELQQKLQTIVNGKTLPEQNVVKESINHLYHEQYYKNFVESLDNIESKLNK